MKPRRITLFALLPSLLTAAACTVSTPQAADAPGPTKVVGPTGGSDAGDAAAPTVDVDAGEVDASAAPREQNNKLCMVSTTCDPDTAETAASCHVAPDGGAYDPGAGYADAGLACRVQPSASIASNGLGMPTTCAVAGPGVAGAKCKLPSDCAAGLDCVGEGVCRHYCCAGNSQCSSQEFCDVQSLAFATTTKVPVCMPIQPPGGCSLWPKGSCTAGTCAIVHDDGTTGCVETGPKLAGESCDVDHCAFGLVCLGALNARLCYALCDTRGTSCTAPQTCQGGLPLFQDPNVGVCQ